MKHLLWFMLSLALAAPQGAMAQASTPEQKPKVPETGQEPPKPEQPKPQEAQPAQPEQAAPAPPAAPAERWLTGSIDVGNRWLLNRGGDFNTYRSVVNLGEGPKLLNLDLTFQPVQKSRWVDRIDVRANSWGGEPYNTAGVDARREGLYRFTFNYSNIAYYNFLPSFADPLQDRGFFLDERSFDTFRRTSDFQLDLHPGKRIVPYLAYSRDSGRGTGITNLVLQSNEYPVHNNLSDRTDNYRGGVRFEFNRWHLTLEQGAINYADDESTGYGQGQSPNLGNLAGTPFFGQTLFLNSGSQAYRIRSDSKYTRAMFTAAPFSWLDVYGQFLYSQPHSSSTFSQTATGNLINLATVGFYTAQFQTLSAEARQPHPGGSFSAVLRPVKRIRITESWMTDRLHNATSALLVDQLIASGGGPVAPVNITDGERLSVNYNQQELNVLFDVTSKLMLRGGWRYVWGDAQAPPALVLEGLQPFETGKLRRNVALAGANFRWSQKFAANFDYEGSPGDRAYFRTSLNEYQKAKIRARYQVLNSLQLTANFLVLHNQNPSPGINYDFMARDNSFGVNWTPGGGKRVMVLAEYSRSTLHSDINYLVPQLLTTDFSRYRDYAHTGTSLVDLTLPGHGSVQPKLSFGGSLFVSSGSRPTRYYQPLGRFAVPIGQHVNWYAEWRWYGMSQPFFLYEGFRSNQFLTGFRFLM